MPTTRPRPLTATKRLRSPREVQWRSTWKRVERQQRYSTAVAPRARRPRSAPPTAHDTLHRSPDLHFMLGPSCARSCSHIAKPEPASPEARAWRMTLSSAASRQGLTRRDGADPMLMRMAANRDRDAADAQGMVGSDRRRRCDRIQHLRRRFGVTRNICGAEHDFDAATWRPRGHAYMHAYASRDRFARTRGNGSDMHFGPDR